MQNTARILLTSAASILAFSAVPVFAQSDPVDFDIDAQPLPKALMEYSEQTNIVVMASAGLVEGKKSDGVEGVDDPDTALHTLLASTGLEHRFLNDETVVIREAPAAELAQESELGKSPPASSPVLMAQNRTPEMENQGSRTSLTADDNDEQVSSQLEEIVVTGSRIRGAQSASPVITLDRAEIDMAGFATVEEIVENLPQNFGAGASSDFDNANINAQDVVDGDVDNLAGGTSVNLRGLGASSTLVLLNGRRMSPSGFRAGFTNIASIPVTAIERVEVMTDGASAIYGSDAIAGVINFILREDYEGAETRLRYGSDSGGDTSSVQFGQTFGTSWNSGNVMLSYEYFDREALASSDRAFTASSDLTPFGGTDWRRPGGSPANIIAGGQFFAIPDGQDGIALTSADFMGLENTQNFFNEREVLDLIPGLERHSGFLHLTQSIGVFELFGAVLFSREENTRRSNAGTIFNFTVTDASPHFVDPTDGGLTEVRVGNYSITEEAGSLVALGELDTFGGTLGAQVAFTDNWSGKLSLNWSKEEAQASRSPGVDTATQIGLAESVNLGDPALAFNPFSDGSNANNRVILERLLVPSLPETSSENELWSASLDLTGSVFELAGGAAKVAAGVDFRRESLSTVGFSGENVSDLSRDIRAVYAELFLPIVGQANSRKGLQRLEVSLAARHEDFTDFGNSTNPKLGVVWSPFQSMTLRGTIGTAYRAPALTNLDDGSGGQTFFLPDSFFGQSVIAATGSNPDLQPEEATTWTVGVQWAPDSIDGLFLDATYFNVDFTDRIETPLRSTGLGLRDPASFPDIVISNPTPEQIARFVNRPNFNEGRFAPGSPEDFISGAIPIDYILDNRLTNLAESLATGVELQLSYATDTALGTFSAGINSSYILDFKRKILPSDPLVDEVDLYGRPVDLRARGSIGWSRNSWSVGGFVNYTDGYTDDGSGPARPDDPRAVGSWTSVDLTVSYRTNNTEGFLSDARLTLTMQNLFDEDPPFVDTRGGVGYDAVNANPLGRFFAFLLIKEW